MTTNPVTYRIGAPPARRPRPRPRMRRPHGWLEWCGAVQTLALIAIVVFYLAAVSGT